MVHGHIYQLLTYGFLHAGFFHLFFNMLMLWMFGSMLEVPWGSRRFLEFFLFGVVGAGLGTVALAYTLGSIVHLARRLQPLALLAESMQFSWPPPCCLAIRKSLCSLPIRHQAQVPGRNTRICGAGWRFGDASGTANVAHLSGLLFGYLYVKFVPTGGLLFSASEASYGFTNRYHRWKRRRAGKKFQVYMKKHNQDAKDYFDEYGNFRPPDDKDKKNGGSTGGWVN